MGLLLMVYSVQLETLFRLDPDVALFFGLRLFLDDLPDVPRRFRKYFGALFAGSGGESKWQVS